MKGANKKVVKGDKDYIRQQVNRLLNYIKWNFSSNED